MTFNLDPGADRGRDHRRARRAIIPVHLYGQMADMDPIMAIARRNNLIVIEDAAQAIGAEYHGRRAGSIGPYRLLSASSPPRTSAASATAAWSPPTIPPWPSARAAQPRHGAEVLPQYVGGNFRLDALQAAVLRVKLPHLDGWTAARQRNAARYRRLFEAGLAGEVVTPHDAGFGRHIYNQFVIRTQRRDAVIAQLKARQIGHEIYYPVPLHLQECFAGWGYRRGEFPPARPPPPRRWRCRSTRSSPRCRSGWWWKSIATAYDTAAE